MLKRKIILPMVEDDAYIVGITGSQKGTSVQQYSRLRDILIGEEPDYIMHGSCIGVDEEAHRFALSLNIKTIVAPGYSMSNPTDRSKRANIVGDIILPENSHFARNRMIVALSNKVFGFPWGTEQKGGTWYTLKFAFTTHKSVKAWDWNGDNLDLLKIFGESKNDTKRIS